jgi:flavodoxin
LRITVGRLDVRLQRLAEAPPGIVDNRWSAPGAENLRLFFYSAIMALDFWQPIRYNSCLQGENMKILVAYYSQTGNTLKVAEAIFSGIKHNQKLLLPIDQVDDPGKYDLIFCGFPVQHHSIPAKMTHFLQSIAPGRKIALFATHGSLRGGEKAIAAFYTAFSLTGGRTILGTFGCRGQVQFALLDKWMEKPQERSWALEAQSANGHPDAADLEDARSFADLMLHSAEHFHGVPKT